MDLLSHLLEAFARQIVAILLARDFDIAVAGECFVHEGDRRAEAVAGRVEGGGEEAGFEARGAEEGLLGERDALEGEKFLGVDGLVEGDEVFLEMGDLLEVFEADHGESGGGEAVFAGILRGAGLARRGSRAGGFGGVGAIGGELLGGDGSFGVRHVVIVPLQGVAREEIDSSIRRSQVMGKKGVVEWRGLVIRPTRRLCARSKVPSGAGARTQGSLFGSPDGDLGGPVPAQMCRRGAPAPGVGCVGVWPAGSRLVGE